MKTAEKDSIKEKVLAEYKKGNIVVSTFEGIISMSLKDCLKQPAEGLLYDLNRDTGTILTFLDDPKWINDYALTRVLIELKNQLDTASEKTAKLEELVKAYKEYAGLLGKSEGNLAVFAATHRIYVDKKTVNKGKQLRKRIEELSNSLK